MFQRDDDRDIKFFCNFIELIAFERVAGGIGDYLIIHDCIVLFWNGDGKLDRGKTTLHMNRF